LLGRRLASDDPGSAIKLNDVLLATGWAAHPVARQALALDEPISI